jgi:hypothetical protein
MKLVATFRAVFRCITAHTAHSSMTNCCFYLHLHLHLPFYFFFFRVRTQQGDALL